MTKAEFKKEVVADLEYQVQHKGKNWTSEAWYFSDFLYPLQSYLKKAAINELIAEGEIHRDSSTLVYPDEKPFPMLYI